MMSGQTAARVLLCGALLLAGCASDGGDSAGPAGGIGQSGAAGEPAAPTELSDQATAPAAFAARSTRSGPSGTEIEVKVDDLGADVPGLDEEKSCWYRKGLVIGPAGVNFVGPGIEKLSVRQVGALQGYEVHSKEIDKLLQVIDVYAIDPDVDPLQAALNLGNGAAPVLMAGYAGHWGYAPGAPPADLVHDKGVPLSQHQLFAGGKVPRATATVGVLDTGFISFPTVPWPAGRIRPASVLDVEPASLPADLAGHGMFVSSAILQRAPESEIVVARVGNTPRSAFTPNASWARADWWSEHVHMADGYASDELQMYYATARLAAAGAADGVVFDALNISMGAYLCDQLSSSGLAIRAAMALWLGEQPSAPVVAAAGNHPVTEPDPGLDFAPADLDLGLGVLAALPGDLAGGYDIAKLDLLAVAALDRDAKTVAPYSNYKPHDVLAVGTDLLSVREDIGVTSWSGSSFATAVVSGAVVHGDGPDATGTYELGSLGLAP